jgi:type I restriction enzyme S subunit
MRRQPPSGWLETTLGLVARPVFNRIDPRTIPELPFIGLEHVESRTLRLISIGSSLEVRGAVLRFSAGDVLYGRLRPNLVKVVRPEFEGVCSAEFIVFTEAEGLSTAYLKFVLASPRFTDFAAQLAKGDRPRVDVSQLTAFPFEMPPASEQQRISVLLEAYWSRLLEARDLLRSLPERVTNYRQEVLASAFRGQLTADWRQTHPDVEHGRAWAARWAEKRNAGDVGKRELDTEEASRPIETWTTERLGRLFEVSIGATPNRKEPTYWGGEIPWVSSGEIAFNRIRSTRETITQLGLERSSTELHRAGTVLLAMIGEGKTRGRAAILDIAACNNQNSAAVRVSDTELPPEYLFYFLWHNYERTRRLAEGNSQPALNKARVESITFPLAPKEEAELIVARIGELFGPMGVILEKGAEAEHTVDHLTQTLLDEALHGELVTATSNIEEGLAAIMKLAERAPGERAPAKVNTSTLDDLRRVLPQSPARYQSLAKGIGDNRADLSSVLDQAQGEATPEQLFQAAGYNPEDMEVFFLALRDAVQAGRIIEDRSHAGRIILRSKMSA